MSDYKSLAEKIDQHYVQPAFLKDMDEFTTQRVYYRIWGCRFEVIGKVLTAFTTITAFGTSAFPDFKYGNVVSGLIGVFAMLFQHMSSYYLNESHEYNERINHILVKLGIQIQLPDEKPDV